MKIVLSGGTGFIGRALLKRLLEKGHTVVLLARNPDAARRDAENGVTVIQWDGKNVGEWRKEVDGADAIVNLAGEPVVGKRWTDEQKSRILGSRVNATKAIVAAIEQASMRPSVLMNASAVGYYGDVESGDVTESHPKGSGFLGDLCAQWEEAALKAERLGARVVCLRIGIVLEKDGGALSKMIPPFQMFMGGPLGSGRQWVPWVHREDLIHIILFALENKNLSGPVNATSPEPVTMKEFCSALGKAMHRPSWAPVPAFVLRILLGESSKVLLTGQRAVPQKLRASGYTFRYPRLDEALIAALSGSSSQKFD